MTGGDRASARSPSTSLLLATVSAALGTAPADLLPTALDEDASSGLVDAARRAGVAPLVHAALVRCGRPRLAAGGERLAREYTLAAARHVAATVRLEPALQALTERGVPVVFLKGLALAEGAYGDPALRPMTDVDLLVAGDDVAAAAAALSEAGWDPPATFVRDRHRRAAAMFLSRTPAARGLVIDLHWSLVDGKAGPAAQHWVDAARRRAAPMSVGPVRALGLEPTDALIHAAAHVGLHHGLLGLRTYCDIAAIVQAWGSAIDWERLADDARRARLIGVVGVVFRAAASLVGARIPGRFWGRLGVRRGARITAARAVMATAAGQEMLVLRGFGRQDYVVPLLLADRGRDALGVVARWVALRLADRVA